MPTEKDDYLLQSLLSGDEKGVAEIYRQVFPKIVSFILKNKGQYADAEDIFHKVLLQLSTRIKVQDFELTTSFDGYVFTACKNLWRRELNKKDKWVTNDRIVERVDEEEDLALAILDQDRWELFKDSMEKLSENCKEVLQFFFNKLSYKEIVGKTSYSSETVVRQRVFKCKAKLSNLIQSDKRFKALKT
ncbi:RNA polymerase subunit sigma [Flavobacteriaceae bacterium (ex Bugula neritina AB1)]|nr:RNA polymerase subunit sigma [Flavobacteriaceae bacterium (ex Bugula neritina AB1)]